jgi:hypothetical protein
VSTEDIARRRQAWTGQLRAQGLRPMDAARLALAEARQEVTELEIRLAAADPVKWYGPSSPEARQHPAGLTAQAEAEVAASRARFEVGQRELLAGPGPGKHTPARAPNRPDPPVGRQPARAGDGTGGRGMSGTGSLTTTCPQCGDHQSGDPSGRCFDCRAAEPGYLARLNARVRDLMTRGPQVPKTAAAEAGEPGAFRFFWVGVVRQACPECELPTATGFGRHDPDAETREPARCTDCSGERIEWAALQESRALTVFIGTPVRARGSPGSR